MQRDPSFEELCSALLYLLSRNAGAPSPLLAALIRDHLGWLSAHPEAADLPALQKTCSRLARHWEQRAPTGGDPAPLTPGAPCTLH